MSGISSRWPVWRAFSIEMDHSVWHRILQSQAATGFPFGANSTYMMQLYLWENEPAIEKNPRARDTRHPSQAITCRPALIWPVASPFTGDLTQLLDVCCTDANMPMCATAASRHTAISHISSLPLQQPPLPHKTHISLSVKPTKTLPPLLKNLAMWETALQHDPDKNFILNSISNDFFPNWQKPICPLPQPQTVSHHSSPTPSIAKISEELSSGNNQLWHAQPTIISPISTLPKPDGGLRLIHDLTLPGTYGVNAYALKDPCKH